MDDNRQHASGLAKSRPPTTGGSPVEEAYRYARATSGSVRAKPYRLDHKSLGIVRVISAVLPD